MVFSVAVGDKYDHPRHHQPTDQTRGGHRRLGITTESRKLGGFFFSDSWNKDFLNIRVVRKRWWGECEFVQGCWKWRHGSSTGSCYGRLLEPWHNRSGSLFTVTESCPSGLPEPILWRAIKSCCSRWEEVDSWRASNSCHSRLPGVVLWRVIKSCHFVVEGH